MIERKKSERDNSDWSIYQVVSQINACSGWMKRLTGVQDQRFRAKTQRNAKNTCQRLANLAPLRGNQSSQKASDWCFVLFVKSIRIDNGNYCRQEEWQRRKWVRLSWSKNANYRDNNHRQTKAYWQCGVYTQLSSFSSVHGKRARKIIGLRLFIISNHCLEDAHQGEQKADVA